MSNNSCPLTDVPDEQARQDAQRLFRALFAPDEFVFAGWSGKMNGELGTTVRTRREWELFFQDSPFLPMAFLPNPIFPTPKPTQLGELSFRATKSIRFFRNAPVQFNAVPADRQLAFWNELNFQNLVALVATGTGLWEGILRADAVNEAHWKSGYSLGWVPLGCNPRFGVPTRLVCMAGGMNPMVSNKFRETHPAEEIPPPVRNKLIFAAPELQLRTGVIG